MTRRKIVLSLAWIFLAFVAGCRGKTPPQERTRELYPAHQFAILRDSAEANVTILAAMNWPMLDGTSEGVLVVAQSGSRYVAWRDARESVLSHSTAPLVASYTKKKIDIEWLPNGKHYSLPRLLMLNRTMSSGTWDARRSLWAFSQLGGIAIVGKYPSEHILVTTPGDTQWEFENNKILASDGEILATAFLKSGDTLIVLARIQGQRFALLGLVGGSVQWKTELEERGGWHTLLPRRSRVSVLSSGARALVDPRSSPSVHRQPFAGIGGYAKNIHGIIDDSKHTWIYTRYWDTSHSWGIKRTGPAYSCGLTVFDDKDGQFMRPVFPDQTADCDLLGVVQTNEATIVVGLPENGSNIDIYTFPDVLKSDSPVRK